VEDPAFTNPPGGVTTAARPAVQTAPVKENRVRAELHQTLAAELGPGEELRWFTVAYQYKAPRFVVGLFGWSILLPILGPLIAMVLRRPWTVGVTSSRIMFEPFEYGLGNKKASARGFVSVPLGDVTAVRKGRRAGLLVLARHEEGLPTTLRLQRGNDIDGLEPLLHT
jgi:hypothetical protein